MKNYWYEVFFSDSSVGVSAGNEEEAKVLAQAERIKAGLTWRDIEGVVKDDGYDFTGDMWTL